MLFLYNCILRVMHIDLIYLKIIVFVFSYHGISNGPDSQIIIHEI